MPFYAKGEHVSEVSPCDYNGNDMCIFRKGLCIGDSLTEGTFNYKVNGSIANYVNYPEYSYPKYLQKLTGVEIINKGLGGLTSSRWWGTCKDHDMSGYDFAIIQLGVNDAIYNEGWTNESKTAFENIINKLKAENNNIKIFVSTIIPATSYTGEHINSVSDGIRQLVQTLNNENIVLLDMAKYGHTAEEEAYNNGHLSAYGYYRLAQDYKNYIGWIIANKKPDFRNVQFIGTDYEY
jgi:lysophospholipase L1-like esterase